jgi:hypothetical protein
VVCGGDGGDGGGRAGDGDRDDLEINWLKMVERHGQGLPSDRVLAVLPLHHPRAAAAASMQRSHGRGRMGKGGGGGEGVAGDGMPWAASMEEAVALCGSLAHWEVRRPLRRWRGAF